MSSALQCTINHFDREENPMSASLTLPCGLRLPNRIVKVAMEECLADFGGGRPTEGHSRLYEIWARGEWGMVITGQDVVCSSRPSPVCSFSRLTAFSSLLFLSRRQRPDRLFFSLHPLGPRHPVDTSLRNVFRRPSGVDLARSSLQRCRVPLRHEPLRLLEDTPDRPALPPRSSISTLLSTRLLSSTFSVRDQGQLEGGLPRGSL